MTNLTVDIYINNKKLKMSWEGPIENPTVIE
jgi:hypothetical protein